MSVVRQYRGRLPIAVATGATRPILDQILRHIGLTGWFDAEVCSEEVPHHKPAPDVFLEAARRLKVDPRKCLVYEDTDPGIEAARRAEMEFVDVRTVFKPRRSDELNVKYHRQSEALKCAVAFVDFAAWDYTVESPLLEPLGGSQSALCFLALELARLGHEMDLLQRHHAAGRRWRSEPFYRPVRRGRQGASECDAVVLQNVVKPAGELRRTMGTGRPTDLVDAARPRSTGGAVAARGEHARVVRRLRAGEPMATAMLRRSIRTRSGACRVLPNAPGPPFASCSPMAARRRPPRPGPLCWPTPARRIEGSICCWIFFRRCGEANARGPIAGFLQHAGLPRAGGQRLGRLRAFVSPMPGDRGG